MRLFPKKKSSSRKSTGECANKENTDLLIDNLIISTNKNLNRFENSKSQLKQQQISSTKQCESYKNKVNGILF